MPATRKNSSNSSNSSRSGSNYSASMRSLARLHKRLRKIEAMIESNEEGAMDSIAQLEAYTEKMVKLLGSPSPATRRNRR